MTEHRLRDGLGLSALMMSPMLETKSAVPEVVWPAITAPHAASVLAVQFQLDRTQHWSAEALQSHQLAQLDVLLRYSCRTVPFYRDRLGSLGGLPHGALTMERWQRLPRITRRDIQEAGDRLLSTDPPKGHGAIGSTRTSGSTGTPIQAVSTELTQVFFNSIGIRNALWRQLNMSASVAVLRRDRDPHADPKHGRILPDWGQPCSLMFQTGPAAIMDIRRPTADQVDWLVRRRPTYLLTMPSNLSLVARYCLDHHIALPTLRHIRTLGEVVPDDLRALCQEAWGVPIADSYSAEEVGYIALQCPLHTHYHVQSEALLVEVLDENGARCGPGQVGRVVVTPLHNFAMPLLRYDIGDYAEVGPPCDCGRNLPVLKRILGRARSSVVLPNGERRYAYFGAKGFGKVAAVVQFQVVQVRLDLIELRLVARRELTDDEATFLRDLVRTGLGDKFPVNIVYVSEIPRTDSGKFEDFRSDIP